MMELVKEKSTGKKFYILGFLENFCLLSDVRDGVIRKVSYGELTDEYIVRRFL